MKDLRVGDQVLTVSKKGKPVYDVVCGFLHREEDTVAMFLNIGLRNGGSLKLTPLHMLYTSAFKVVPAYKLSVGDEVFVASENGIEIQKISAITKSESTGIYAPLTYRGNIVVDGVLASCYAEHDSMNSQKTAHLVLAPLRLKARVLGVNKKENTKNGVNSYCEFLADSVYPTYKKVVFA